MLGLPPFSSRICFHCCCCTGAAARVIRAPPTDRPTGRSVHCNYDNGYVTCGFFARKKEGRKNKRIFLSRLMSRSRGAPIQCYIFVCMIDFCSRMNPAAPPPVSALIGLCLDWPHLLLPSDCGRYSTVYRAEKEGDPQIRIYSRAEECLAASLLGWASRETTVYTRSVDPGMDVESWSILALKRNSTKSLFSETLKMRRLRRAPLRPHISDDEHVCAS